MYYGFEIEINNFGVNYTTLLLKENNLYGYFTVVSDSSVVGGSEIKTRNKFKLDSTFLSNLRKLIKVLNSEGATVNWRCGIHIHVDMRELSLDEIKNMVLLFYKHQDLLHEKFNLRKTVYSSPIDEHEIERLKKHTSVNRGVYGFNKHNCVNLNFERTPKKTIEFRLFDSTLDIKRILLYFKTVDALVHQIKTKKTYRYKYILNKIRSI